MTQNSRKPKHQLDLLDEKRAFVVIALTDRLSLPGKLVALNALAHYNSERGYSWASIPVVAEESGYSPASTKSISPGFDEIEKVGAFRVVRNPPRKGSKKSSTHRCCPVMPWFRQEYERLRQAGKIESDDDPFADIRSDNDNALRQGSQPGREGSQPDQTEPATLSDGANDPVRRGYKPDEENRLRGTDRNEQIQTKHDHAGADRGPVGGDVDGDGGAVSRSTPPGGVWADDMIGKFQSNYPKGGDRSKIAEALEEIRREGRTDYRDILRGANNYRGENVGVEPRFLKSPENFLKGRLWTGYQKDNRPKPKKTAAI